jgi:uncharacterized SAM-binding protein YcdF (DUF218 family)
MSATFFLLKKILASLVLPPSGPLLLVIAGLLLAPRWQRVGKWLAWGGVASLLALSLPTTATLLARAVTLEPAHLRTDAGAAQAIVILGGGRQSAPEYGGETVSEAALERVRYGATLARQFQLPVLVTGGRTGSQAIPEAELMAATLEKSFDMKVRWKETRSRDTHENAMFSAELLRGAGVHSVLLVTHDIHQRRGIAEFRAAGIEASPAAISSPAVPSGELLSAYLPNASALRRSSLALHEILGNMVAP